MLLYVTNLRKKCRPSDEAEVHATEGLVLPPCLRQLGLFRQIPGEPLEHLETLKI